MACCLQAQICRQGAALVLVEIVETERGEFVAQLWRKLGAIPQSDFGCLIHAHFHVLLLHALAFYARVHCSNCAAACRVAGHWSHCFGRSDLKRFENVQNAEKQCVRVCKHTRMDVVTVAVLSEHNGKMQKGKG